MLNSLDSQSALWCKEQPYEVSGYFVALSELLVPLLLLLLAGALIFSFILLRAHEGYLHLFSTLCRCSFSKSWGLEQTALALWYRVLTTLCLDMLCGGYPTANKSQCGWVFCRLLLRLPPDRGMTRMAKKGMEPSALESSPVNCVHWSV